MCSMWKWCAGLFFRHEKTVNQPVLMSFPLQENIITLIYWKLPHENKQQFTLTTVILHLAVPPR